MYRIVNDAIKIFEHITHVFNATGTVIQHHFHVSINGVKFSKIYLVVMKYKTDNNCSFNFGTVHCNPPDFDSEYEKLVKEMKKNLQNDDT